MYLQKRKAQGLMTIEQVAEWAPQYSLEIQRTIRYVGMKILDENEFVEKAHAILKIWGDALQTITSPKPFPPPTFLALSPVFSFHPYIKAGLWTLTEPTASSTRRLSWMKRERRIIKSWIHLSTRIHSSRLLGA